MEKKNVTRTSGRHVPHGILMLVSNESSLEETNKKLIRLAVSAFAFARRCFDWPDFARMRVGVVRLSFLFGKTRRDFVFVE